MKRQLNYNQNFQAKGLSEKLIQQISVYKHEPKWMFERRIEGLKAFMRLSLPKWGPDLSNLDFNSLYYFLPSISEQTKWEDVPEEIKMIFEKLGIPQAEQKQLAGVKSQFDSEVIYGSLKSKLKDQGVIFLSMDEAVKQCPELVQEYFGTVVFPNDNKFAALNTAVWSGGSFIYVPKNIEVELPLQAYFRINSPLAGQFERTLIILDEGAKLHYIEGCSAPVYSANSLHCGVVEIIVKKKAHCQYSTIQNWYTNVYNLVTKRAYVWEEATMVWVDGNLGSKVTMKYPSCFLMGEKAHGELLSMSMAGKGQVQDSGGSMVHKAPQTTSSIISKSISRCGGKTVFRGWINIDQIAKQSRAKAVCNNLILDDKSHTATYPSSTIHTDDVIFEHEATVSKVSEEQLFYLKTRGLNEKQATSMILSGFMEPIIKEFPMEYAVELNRLIEIELEKNNYV